LGTADELNALLGTMWFWARLSPQQRDAYNRVFHQQLGRPVAPKYVACLVTAQREPRT
jgi:hypothetical protein